MDLSVERSAAPAPARRATTGDAVARLAPPARRSLLAWVMGADVASLGSMPDAMVQSALTGLANAGGAHRIALDKATFDGLTGVRNKASGLEQMRREVDRAHRQREPLVAAQIDVDRFKQVNDQHGHAAGDRLLRAVADALRQASRSYDVVSRTGGDEFVCLFPKTAVPEAMRVVERATALLPERISISVGLSQLEPRDTLEDLVARADAAMYAARRDRGYARH